MSAVSDGAIPEGAPSGSHRMVSVRRRGNIHQRITLAPADFICASPSANGAGLPSTPARPHDETPPKSPAKLRHAQFAPYMNRFSQLHVTPAPVAGQVSWHAPPDPVPGSVPAPVPGSAPVTGPTPTLAPGDPWQARRAAAQA